MRRLLAVTVVSVLLSAQPPALRARDVTEKPHFQPAEAVSVNEVTKPFRSIASGTVVLVVMISVEDGLTDSFGMPFRSLNDGLGFVRGACCPHYDGEKARRPALIRLIKRGFPSTLALDDGAAAHFVGTRLKEVVSSRPKARAMRIEAQQGCGCRKGTSAAAPRLTG